MNLTSILLFFGGLVAGLAMKDALRIVFVSALLLPVVVIGSVIFGGDSTFLSNLATGFYWYGLMLGGLIAGLLGAIGRVLVCKRPLSCSAEAAGDV